MKQTTKETLDQLDQSIKVLRRKVYDYCEKKNRENRNDVMRIANKAISELLEIIVDVQ